METAFCFMVGWSMFCAVAIGFLAFANYKLGKECDGLAEELDDAQNYYEEENTRLRGELLHATFSDNEDADEAEESDVTRDLPAVDSGFTFPKVDADTLLYRGLMGSSEMEDAVKAMVDYCYPRRDELCRLLFASSDFKNCMTGFRMLLENGWLYSYGKYYKASQSLMERICTRPELAAKITPKVRQ